MSNRSIRDGVVLVGGFHFLMAVLCVVAVAAVFVFAVLPPVEKNEAGLTQELFVPVLGIILGLVIAGVYATTGLGLIQLKNSARMTAIFLGALGVFGGFIGVMSSIAAKIVGQAQPDWVSVTFVGLATICVYLLISFMNIFLLIFLFNPRLRAVFYGEEWVASATETEGDLLRPPKGSRKSPTGDEDVKPISSLSDLKN
jgi:hypothetical protein